MEKSSLHEKLGEYSERLNKTHFQPNINKKKEVMLDIQQSRFQKVQ